MRRRPVMRYHGGKFRLASWVVSYFPEHQTYLEPFGGAGSVLLRKERSYAEIYNDLDKEVVNVFRVLRDPQLAQRLKAMCELTPFSRVEFEESYAPTADVVDQARRTIFRSFAGHGSAAASGQDTGFRSNVTRSGSIPAGDWVTWHKHIDFFTERLRGVVVESRPAVGLIKKHGRKDTLIYVDPPYVPSTRSKKKRSHGSGAYRHEMTNGDHVELLNTLIHSDAMVILSGYKNPIYNFMLRGWHSVEKSASIDGGDKRTEVLWINEHACNALRSAA